MFILISLLLPLPARADEAKERFRAARIAFEQGRLDEAAAGFREVVEKHRASEVGIYAAQLLLECLNRQRRFDEMETAATWLCALPELTRDRELVLTCERLSAAFSRRRVDALAREEKWSEAALECLRFVERHPRDPTLDQVLYNASVLFDKAGDRQRAIAARLKLRKLWPSSSAAKRAGEALRVLP